MTYDEEPEHYSDMDDDVICIGWALMGLTFIILCLVGFIIVEVAF